MLAKMRRTKRQGFTFLELMFVVVIIGILLSIVVPRLAGKSEKARIAATNAQINSIATALQTFEMNAGRFPTTEEGLKALVERPADIPEGDWQGPYLTKKVVPKDVWKEPFVYRCPGEHGIDYDIFSKGPDRQEGTEDDITNWEEEEAES